MINRQSKGNDSQNETTNVHDLAGDREHILEREVVSASSPHTSPLLVVVTFKMILKIHYLHT
jgi:hypothetical protein